MQPEVEDPRHARYGLALFGIYVLLYGGFIALAVFNTPLMGQPVLFGLNLAITYGFGLIIAALVLALVYMWLCRGEHPPYPPSKGEQTAVGQSRGETR